MATPVSIRICWTVWEEQDEIKWEIYLNAWLDENNEIVKIICKRQGSAKEKTRVARPVAEPW